MPWCHFDHAVIGPFIAMIALGKIMPRQQKSELDMAPLTFKTDHSSLIDFAAHWTQSYRVVKSSLMCGKVDANGTQSGCRPAIDRRF